MRFHLGTALLSLAVFAMLAFAPCGCAPLAKRPPPVLGGPDPEPDPVAVAVTNHAPTLDEAGFYAACSQDTPGSHAGPWTGPLRTNRAEAQQDADQHNTQNRGHRATVLEY